MWLILLTLFYAVIWPTGVSAEDEGSVRNYDGYKVYNLTIDSSTKLNFIKEYDGLDGYDFWLLPQRGNAHLMVAPEFQSDFQKDLKKNRIVYSIINEDVGESIQQDAEAEEGVARAFETPGPFNFKYFPRYQEIRNFIKALVNKRKYSRMIKIGTSYEGRPIYGVEVFFIDAGIHAREWATHISALYIIKNVVESEEKFADMMTFVIIPCLNPDGYEYSHTTDRLWRKSMSLHTTSQCKGVDLNRNFDSHWGEFRSEKNPCTEIYGGPEPFSESETSALRDSILKYKPVAYVTIHSFGPLLLYPYGYTKDLPPNWRTLHRIATKTAQNIEKVNGTNYVVGSAARVLYVSSGGSDDWAYDEAEVPIVYTMELPEYEKNSFIVPKKYIKPLITETYVGFATLLQNIYEKYGV
ncbi:hypothetical protein TSAR_014267 [Trichomalopsis sarcophagae]|uniref:Peptidase M14 domain-containing protein n=1 Tax=Trichomalopsis sarcophagae TaxID=543379 RepID=A0A232EU69_9HYME|nr:hypothetical protein TSAR_014267 [Trichomalopsis sarcophagae]